MKRYDAAVLGAGMVGISTAIHLQMRGRSVALVDRRGAAEETSFGNAGLIQREGVYPYGFPQDLTTLLRYASNRGTGAYYHPSALPELVPFLWQYWKNSRPGRHAEIARRYAPLIERCVAEHEALASAAGAAGLIRKDGWIKLFRTARERDARFAEAEQWRREFGINFRALDAAELQRMEPHLAPVLSGALHWTDPASVSDPHALGMAYLELFRRLGGEFLQGDARSLVAEPDGWRLSTAAGAIAAHAAVVALGPWSDLVTRPLGYDFPLAVKRGYHMHYRPAGEARLNYPLLDAEGGFFIGPMRGPTGDAIRITTGAEFARRDAPMTPVQLERVEPIARALFPLAERLDPRPWMGARPCTPDMLPVIGQAPRHRSLWLAFGHAHHGFTLGPATGRLLAELITGEAASVDPAAFSPARFAGPTRPAS
jgi:D-amino-acid dehydrogenase